MLGSNYKFKGQKCGGSYPPKHTNFAYSMCALDQVLLLQYTLPAKPKWISSTSFSSVFFYMAAKWCFGGQMVCQTSAPPVQSEWSNVPELQQIDIK